MLMAGLLKRSGYRLIVVWILSSFSLIQCATNIPHCDNVTADSFGTCCPCVTPEPCDTSQTCPSGYQPYNTTTNKCGPGTDTTTQTTFTLTPDDVTETITTDDENQTSSNSFGNVNEYTICFNCKNSEYFDGSQCVPCHQLCLKCDGYGTENCNPCRITYQGSCVSDCPDGTNETAAVDHEGIVCVSTTHDGQSSDEKEFPVAIVAGAAGGGVLLLVVVIVVVVIVVRRRNSRTNGRTRMSAIIEDKNNGGDDDKKETRPPVTSRRINYENQPRLDTLPRDIVTQGDNVLRYTKDPTERINQQKAQPQTSRDSGLYANNAMIRVHETFKDKRVSQEKLNDELEQAEVDQLPAAPPLPVAKKKAGRIHRISKFLSGEKKGNKMIEHKEEEYIDMDSAKASVNQAFQPDTHTEEQLDELEQEDYEDVAIGAQIDDPEKDMEDMEDYENVGKKLNKLNKPGKATPSRKGAQGGKVNNDKTKGEKRSYENEEVVKQLKRKGDKNERDESESDKNNGELSDTQEDYENVKTIKAGHGASKISNDGEGHTKQGQGQVGGQVQRSSNEEDTGVDLADHDQEDYENTAEFKKNVVTLEPGRAESNYENVQFRKK